MTVSKSACFMGMICAAVLIPALSVQASLGDGETELYSVSACGEFVLHDFFGPDTSAYYNVESDIIYSMESDVVPIEGFFALGPSYYGGNVGVSSNVTQNEDGTYQIHATVTQYAGDTLLNVFYYDLCTFYDFQSDTRTMTFDFSGSTFNDPGEDQDAAAAYSGRLTLQLIGLDGYEYIEDTYIEETYGAAPFGFPGQYDFNVSYGCNLESEGTYGCSIAMSAEDGVAFGYGELALNYSLTPEPGSCLLLMAGGLALLRRRRSAA